ncbi:MAG: hypothetical protein OEM38_04115 [Gammaproteobacteria bacterium]|nr:hypothetical protein [Gammaproteobacteria bacterium]
MANGDRLPMEVMARRDDWQAGISLFARQITVGNGSAIAEPLLFKTPENEAMCVEPFMKIDIQTAQQFMDELWQCGLRPTEGTGSAGSFAAQEKHLQDMRTITFKKLNIDI